MNDDLLNILSQGNKDIDNQKLIDYLAGKLSGKEKYEFEKNLLDSDLARDAVEGLNKFQNKKNPVLIAEQINRHLHNQLAHKKSVKEKRRIKDLPWLYFTIILLIIIILIAFFVVWKFL